jgi:Na+/melibiose symporter-like transporter
LLLYFFSTAFSSMSTGFTGKQDFLFKEVYQVPPSYLSVGGVVSSVWDAANDPVLGSWMDKKRLNSQSLRNILRLSGFVVNTLTVVKMIDGGLSAFWHVFLMALCNMTGSITGTMAGVADQKMRAAISPLSQQRGRIGVWSAMGGQFTWAIGNLLPTLLMGFQSVFHISYYQIIFFGACILLPFSITSAILPTFIRQRVDYSTPPETEEQAAERAYMESLPRRARMHYKMKRQATSLGHTFEVVKYNKYFIANSVANLITTLSPDVGDELMIYSYLFPKFRVPIPGAFRNLAKGKAFVEMGGEALLGFKQVLCGIPSTILQPFNRQLINWMGGPLRAHKACSALKMGSNAVKYFVGYKSWPRLIVLILCEAVFYTANNWDGVAASMLNYEFYDYVELKTGERSEGVTTAVNNMFSKIVTNNIGLVTGNAFITWTGYKGGYKESGTTPPARYLKWMWPMFTLIPVLDQGIWLAARSMVKWTPEDNINTELALAERREVLKQMKSDD